MGAGQLKGDGVFAFEPGKSRTPVAVCPDAMPRCHGLIRDASEGKGSQRGPQRRLGRRLEGVTKAVEGGCCRLQMPLRLALGVRGTVAGHRLGALEGGWWGLLPFQCIPGPDALPCHEAMACGHMGQRYRHQALSCCVSLELRLATNAPVGRPPCVRLAGGLTPVRP